MSGKKTIGPWTLHKRLGRGGNAEVWRAERHDGLTVALKILNARNPKSDSYRRFRREINVVRALAELPGVLRLIEADLPEEPSAEMPPWLAMPEAIPLKDALGSSPELRVVAEAIRSIADTLVVLHARGIYHRDIKPGNLYWYAERWSVGDFGLAVEPESEGITDVGQKLGPTFYLAPEMLNTAGSANGGPADVYSLAKTLWVLATGQTSPLQGEQRVDTPQMGIGPYVPHPRVRELDYFAGSMHAVRSVASANDERNGG